MPEEQPQRTTYAHLVSETFQPVHLWGKGKKYPAEETKGRSGEAGDRKHGPVEEAVGGEEADSRGHDPTVPAATASHPSKQCEYLKVCSLLQVRLKAVV